MKFRKVQVFAECDKLGVGEGHVEALGGMLRRQGGLCALTGYRIKLGWNAALRFIGPSARHGADPDNLHWVHREW